MVHVVDNVVKMRFTSIAALLLSIIIFLAVCMRMEETFFYEYDENNSKMQIKRIVNRSE